MSNASEEKNTGEVNARGEQIIAGGKYIRTGSPVGDEAQAMGPVDEGRAEAAEDAEERSRERVLDAGETVSDS
jgi:hypothetical protein